MLGAILGRYLFKDRMGLFHFIGMALLIGCALLIGFSDSAPDKGYIVILGRVFQKESPIIPVILALASSLCMTAGNLVVKGVYVWLKVPPMDFRMSSALTVNMIMLIIGLCILPGYDLDPEVYWRTFIASIVAQLALVLTSVAMTLGLSGPVSAMVST